MGARTQKTRCNDPRAYLAVIAKNREAVLGQIDEMDDIEKERCHASIF